MHRVTCIAEKVDANENSCISLLFLQNRRLLGAPVKNNDIALFLNIRAIFLHFSKLVLRFCVHRQRAASNCIFLMKFLWHFSVRNTIVHCIFSFGQLFSIQFFVGTFSMSHNSSRKTEAAFVEMPRFLMTSNFNSNILNILIVIKNQKKLLRNL